MKIGLILQHNEAASILRGAGVSVPKIPAGRNTISQHFTTAAGQAALVINQTGFAPLQTDNEEECNGCMIAIALDPDIDAIKAQAALEQCLNHLLK